MEHARANTQTRTRPSRLVRAWEELMRETRNNPTYRRTFRFLDEDMTGNGWRRSSATPRPGQLKVFAIDCEMCVTQDTRTGMTNDKAPLRVTVVHAATFNKILDMKIKPELPVVDFRTEIHGIKPSDPSNNTLEDVQHKLLWLVTTNAILVGHAIDNDLKALRFQHNRIVDTARLYSTDTGRPASLSCISEQVLGGARNAHDSFHDAMMALLCAVAFSERLLQGLQQKVDTWAALLTGSERGSVRAWNRQSRIVHRLNRRTPRSFPCFPLDKEFANAAQAQQYIVRVCGVQPQSVRNRVGSSDPYGRCDKWTISFESRAHYYRAFLLLLRPRLLSCSCCRRNAAVSRLSGR